MNPFDPDSLVSACSQIIGNQKRTVTHSIALIFDEVPLFCSMTQNSKSNFAVKESDRWAVK
jgi:hypothetical protein